MRTRNLTEAVDQALEPYLSGAQRRRFVAERVAQRLRLELLERLAEAMKASQSPVEPSAGVLTHARDSRFGMAKLGGRDGPT